MKRSLLATSAALSLVLPVFASSCALDEAPPVSSGGKAGSSGSTSGGSGNSGGAMPTSGSGGMTTTGGSGNTGGSGGSGGATGGGGSGGATGGSGGSGGGGAITIDEFAGIPNEYGFAFKSAFLLTPCTSTENWDCLTVVGACPNQGAANFEDRGSTFKERFEMGGTEGKTYEVTIQVNGVSEAKYYQGGTRRRGEDFSDADSPDGTDTWYVGGSAVESPYNVEKITVYQPDGTTEVEHYYLNSYPAASGYEAHRTFLISYEATFDVPGGGYIDILNQDSNCRAINNCDFGVLTGAECPNPRNVPHEPALEVPEMFGGQPVSTLNAINGAQQPFHSQIVHITVTNVVEKP